MTTKFTRNQLMYLMRYSGLKGKKHHYKPQLVHELHRRPHRRARRGR